MSKDMTREDLQELVRTSLLRGGVTTHQIVCSMIGKGHDAQQLCAKQAAQIERDRQVIHWLAEELAKANPDHKETCDLLIMAVKSERQDQ